MDSPRRICVVMGTRPEVIKCWPVLRHLQSLPRFEVRTILTGQHRELADQAVRLLGIPVTADLNVMTANQSLESLTARLCERLGDALREIRPDVVLVQGDTTSAFAGALAAFYAQIPVGHIEAGLRTRDVRHPFPEEMNRRLASVLAEVHFAPTPAARTALLREGVDHARVYVTGNTGIDALRLMLEEPDRFPVDPSLSSALETAPGPIIAVTVHRRENRRFMRGIAEAMRELARRRPDVRLVFPVHLSPTVRDAFLPVLEHCPGCRLLEPLDYAGFVRLLARCTFVLTDSGGVQEEAPFLGKPVLVLRRTTERPEAVQAGVARLVGECPQAILDAALQLLTDDAALQRMSRRISPYGDGHAAERIASVLSAGQPRCLPSDAPHFAPASSLPVQAGMDDISRPTSAPVFATEPCQA